MPRIQEKPLRDAVDCIVDSLIKLNTDGHCNGHAWLMDNEKNMEDFMEEICLIFDSLEKDSLDQHLLPVQEKLRSLDARKLLSTERCEIPYKQFTENDKYHDNGRNDQIYPIHDLISPPTPVRFRQDKNCNYIRYLHVTENEFFSIGVFVFPPHTKIPLHDHPGMCVLSRVLYGEVEVESYDILRSEEQVDEYTNKPRVNHSSWFPNFLHPFSHNVRTMPYGSKRARKAEKKIFRAPEVSTLFPLEGNLHEFKAGDNGAAILDVLIPPYDDDERECTYYAEKNIVHEIETDDFIAHSDSAHDTCWLVPINQPTNFHCVGGDFGSFTR